MIYLLLGLALTELLWENVTVAPEIRNLVVPLIPSLGNSQPAHLREMP